MGRTAAPAGAVGLAARTALRPGGGELAFRHGLQRAAPSAPPIYLLDFDHYEQRLRAFDVADDAERLRRFNTVVNDVFRWSITEEKYHSFKPEERPDA